MVDISFGTTYDLPGEAFGIEMAVGIRAHTPRGREFLRKFALGGQFGPLYLLPVGMLERPTSDPAWAHALFRALEANPDVTFEEYEIIREGDKYHKLLQEHLG